MSQYIDAEKAILFNEKDIDSFFEQKISNDNDVVMIETMPFIFDLERIARREFDNSGPTQSIIAHCVRASLGIRRSLALTDCEVREWPLNRCMNP